MTNATTINNTSINCGYKSKKWSKGTFCNMRDPILTELNDKLLSSQRNAKVRGFLEAITADIYNNICGVSWRVRVCVGGQLPRRTYANYYQKIFPNTTLSVNRGSHTEQYFLFFLSGLSMLLQHKRILSSEQRHKLKQTNTVHKNVPTGGLNKTLFCQSL